MGRCVQDKGIAHHMDESAADSLAGLQLFWAVWQLGSKKAGRTAQESWIESSEELIQVHRASNTLRAGKAWFRIAECRAAHLSAFPRWVQRVRWGLRLGWLHTHQKLLLSSFHLI